MKPYDGGDHSTKDKIAGELKGKTAAERHYEVQERMRQGIREVLSEEENFPRELLFIGRNMRIVQGNNQYLGSPGEAYFCTELLFCSRKAVSQGAVSGAVITSLSLCLGTQHSSLALWLSHSFTLLQY
jgi:hypothetical protein